MSQNTNQSRSDQQGLPKRAQYIRAIGPRLRWLLNFILALVGLLGANSFYLASITFLEWLREPTIYQNYFYQWMFLGHLLLGLLLILPYLGFGLIHLKNARSRPNRRAVMVGYALFSMGIVVLATGVALTRIDVFQFKNLGLRDPNWRQFAYWSHVIAPCAAVWLYILHRLAGPRIKWRVGFRFGLVTLIATLIIGSLHSLRPPMSTAKSSEGEGYFRPSEARTASGHFIPAETLMMDHYCQKCHQDVYEGWFHSAHHFSSFNNPFYLFSISETRDVVLKRDGSVKASRWCAGCHDPVPFFSGQFDNPEYDIHNDPTAHAGITCTSCHAISSVDSSKGNADYTISEPIHYPFATSTNRVLQYINNQLVKAKPSFHKKMFLKDVFRSSEFCSTCHKVSLPKDVTHYKEWLRGQNHYDPFLLSGAGHGARSFYFPPKAPDNCASCHMPLQQSQDFAADYFNPTNHTERFVHNHLFPAANTAIPHVLGFPEVIKEHEAFSKDSLRIDIFGIREGGTIDGKLVAPLRPETIKLSPGNTYLLELVVRTLKPGHLFSQGTVDSNEIWIDVALRSNGVIIGRSGGTGEHNEVDPWSHFINVYMLDREGNRIDRRNAQDIFTPLYNNQIPPGAGSVVHYKFTVPKDIQNPIEISARLNYRKFDTIYYNYVYGNDYKRGNQLQFANDLPIRRIAQDSLVLAISNEETTLEGEVLNIVPKIPVWQRWNDYGIGLFLKGRGGSNKGQLAQALDAFHHVERDGRSDGSINLARVHLKEGRLDAAASALQRAETFTPPPPRWIMAWLSGQINKQYGKTDEAIRQFSSILEDQDDERRNRNLDFSKDYLIINDLGLAYFEKSKQLRNSQEDRHNALMAAIEQFKRTLALDSENLTAHYNLGLLYSQIGNDQKADTHRQLHTKYKPDDNARDRAIGLARQKDAAANHAAQEIVIYDLQRPGAFELK